MIAAVDEAFPYTAVLALLALCEVSAVDGCGVGRCATAAVGHRDAVEKIVALGHRATVGVDAVAALAQGVVFEFRGLAWCPGDLLKAREDVPFVAANAVRGEVPVIVVGRIAGTLRSNIDGELIV